MSRAASGHLSGSGHSVVRFDCDIPGLFVKRVVLGTDDALSMAVLGAHPQDDSDEDIRIEDAWEIVDKGQKVKITAMPSQGSSRVMLHGWVQGVNITYGGRMEDLEYTVLGLDWSLKAEKVFGSWCKEGNGEDAVWLRAIPPVFNKDGKYNKSTADAEDSEGNKRVVFDLDDDLFNPKSAWWNASHMARYLVSCERKSELSSENGNVFEKDYQPGGEIANFRPFDVNVEDEDIWSALVKVAHRCSHGVRIRYQNDRTKSELAFFTRKIDSDTSAKQIEIPEATLEVVSLGDPMRTVAALDVQHDLSGIVRQIDVVCPPKLFDSTFELLEGWKQEDEDEAFGEGPAGTRIAKFLRETDPQTSSDWERFKWVGRRYILNETGRDDCTTDVGAFNFDDVLGAGDWAVRNRPFRNMRVARSGDDDEGAPLPIAIHVQFGSTMPQDIQLGVDVRLLPDRAGIYFAGSPIVNVARALESGEHTDILADTVSIDAVIEGDQDSPHDVNAILGGFDQPVPTFGIVRLDEGFRQDNVNDETDAEEIASDLANAAVEEMKDARMVGTAVIPWISFAFEPGDIIDRINGRGLDMKALIAKISWDVEQQATELALEYPTIDTATHARHVKSVNQPGFHDGRHAHGLAFVAELLALQELGHPVGEALRAAVGGASRSEVERILEDVIPGKTREDDPTE